MTVARDGEGLVVASVAAEHRGRGVRVAVVDTGVNFQHPHLRVPGRGWSVAWRDGVIEVDRGGYADPHGHGTCCAALVHWLAPEAELWAVRVCGDRPTTDADRIAEGIAQAAEAGADLICVALGTKTALRHGLDLAVKEAFRSGCLVVAADPGAGEEVLPAACPEALAVRHALDVDVAKGPGVWLAEGRARPAPGHPSNFWGPSLACARMCAALARWAEATQTRGDDLLRGFSNSLDVR